jgi:hypothetical protein
LAISCGDDQRIVPRGAGPREISSTVLLIGTAMISLRRGIHSISCRIMGSWLEIIRIVGRDAREKRAQENSVGGRF